MTPETQRDQERRIRREIANSNERRRMQSINAGFQSLKTLIPHTDGEKLSKVGEAQKDFLEEVGGWSREIQETLSAGVPDLSLLPSGSHSPADCGIHLLPGAGEDPAPAAEHTAQALYPGRALPCSRRPSPGMCVSGPNPWLGTGTWLQGPSFC